MERKLVWLAVLAMTMPLAVAPVTTAVSASPEPLPVPAAWTAGASVGGKAYVFGGTDYARNFANIWEYDPVLDKMTTVASMPTPRNSVAVVASGDAIYVFGGHDGGYLDQILRFDTVTKVVTPLSAKLSSPRAHMLAYADQTWIYLVGGDDGSMNFGDIQRFDPATGSIVTLEQTVSPRNAAAGGFIAPYAYVMGGHDGSYRKDILVAGPTVEPSGELPFPLAQAASVSHGGCIVVSGGQSADGKEDDILLFTPTSGAKSVGTLRMGLSKHAAVVFGGLLYTFGGETASGPTAVTRVHPLPAC